MANVRRFFRYDVDVPVYFETVDASGQRDTNVRKELVSSSDETALDDLNTQLADLFDHQTAKDNEAFQIFDMVNQRLNLVDWMLNKLIDCQDPSLEHDYKYRFREDAKCSLPKNTSSTKVGSLIEGAYVQIDDHLAEMQETVANSIDGKIFLFPRKSKPLFQSSDYVKNLDVVAEKGGAALALSLLIKKLNIYETWLNKLKKQYHSISSPDMWPERQINLSAGGFAFETDQVFENFSKMNVFMMLGKDILICRGKMVLNKHMAHKPSWYRVAVEFEFLTEEHSRMITLFVQKKEIADAVAMFSG